MSVFFPGLIDFRHRFPCLRQSSPLPGRSRRLRSQPPPRRPEVMDRRHKIPIAVKLIYSAFVVVLVPYYWITYSPWNFLFFCDLGLLIGAVALWTEDPLLASLPTVGLALPQL